MCAARMLNAQQCGVCCCATPTRLPACLPAHTRPAARVLARWPPRAPVFRSCTCVRAHTFSPPRNVHRLLRETFEPEQLTGVSIFDGSEPTQAVVEVGPRTNFSTAWSTNATSICSSVGLDKVGVVFWGLRVWGPG